MGKGKGKGKKEPVASSKSAATVQKGKGSSNQAAVALADREDELVGEESGGPGAGGPSVDSLRERFEEKHEAWKAAMADVEGAAVSSSPAIASALVKVGEIESLLTEMEAITLTIEARVDTAYTEAEAADAAGDADLADEMTTLADECDALREESMREWSKAKATTKAFNSQLGLTKAQVEKAEADAAKKAADEKAAADAAAAVAKELSDLKGLWGNNELADRHFGDHQADTGAVDELDYFRRAKELSERPTSATVERKTLLNGNTITMDTATKLFCSVSEWGKIRTYFLKNGGKPWFDDQT